MRESQPIQERLAGVWDAHMHDDAGNHVAAVFLTVLRGRKESPFPAHELQNRVLETAFEPLPDNGDAGLYWACAANAVSAMAGETADWLAERKAASNA